MNTLDESTKELTFDEAYVRTQDGKGKPGFVGISLEFDFDEFDEGEELEPYFTIDSDYVGITKELDENSDWILENENGGLIVGFHSINAIDVFMHSADTPENSEEVADWLEECAARVRAKFSAGA